MIQTLYRERRCHQFLTGLYGILGVIDMLDGKLDRADVEMSSNDLMYLHFDKDQAFLMAFLGDADLVAAFRQFYPTLEHVLVVARDLCDRLEGLHAARQDMIRPHLRPDGKDVQREFPHEHAEIQLDDRAKMRGLTKGQQEAFEAQLDRTGFMTLALGERRQLHDAIQTLKSNT